MLPYTSRQLILQELKISAKNILILPNFHISLNHYLWVGFEQIQDSLLSVRRSSELLTATILTVTALHIPSSAKTFDDGYNEILSLISSSMISRYHSVDDVRGLCIAAFWLSDGKVIHLIAKRSRKRGDTEHPCVFSLMEIAWSRYSHLRRNSTYNNHFSKPSKAILIISPERDSGTCCKN